MKNYRKTEIGLLSKFILRFDQIYGLTAEAKAVEGAGVLTAVN